MRALLLTVLLASMSAFGQQDEPALEPELEKFLVDFAKARSKIVSVQAQFDQENIYADDKSYASGTVTYAKPKRVVIRYEEPDSLVWLLDKNEFYEYEAELEQVKVQNIEDEPEVVLLFWGFDDDARRLCKKYHVELFDPENGAPKGARGLLIKPKKNDAAYFKQARIFLRGKDYLPYKIHVVNDEESEFVTDISSIKVNKDLSPAETQIVLPAGTMIVGDGRVPEAVGEGGKSIPGPVSVETDKTNESGSEES